MHLKIIKFRFLELKPFLFLNFDHTEIISLRFGLNNMTIFALKSYMSSSPKHFLFSQTHLLDLVHDFQELEVRRELFESDLINPTWMQPNFEPR